MHNERPTSDPRVSAVLAAASAPAEAPVAGEAAALTAFRRVHVPAHLRLLPKSRMRAKLIVAAAFGTVFVAGTAATAASGNLPVVSSLLGRHHTTHTTSPVHDTGPTTSNVGAAHG